MKKPPKTKSEKSRESLVFKVTMSRAQRDWLKQQVGRGNCSEFIRAKIFDVDYSRNTFPADRYRWELAVALSWVGNNLQLITEKVDDLARSLGAKQQPEAALNAFTGIVKILEECADALVRISKSLSGKDEEK